MSNQAQKGGGGQDVTQDMDDSSGEEETKGVVLVQAWGVGTREEGALEGAVPLLAQRGDLSLREGPGGAGTGVCGGAALQAVPEHARDPLGNSQAAQVSAPRPCPAHPSSALWHPWQLVNRQEATRGCGRGLRENPSPVASRVYRGWLGLDAWSPGLAWWRFHSCCLDGISPFSALCSTLMSLRPGLPGRVVPVSAPRGHC